MLKDFNIRATVEEQGYDPGVIGICIQKSLNAAKDQATVDGYYGFYTTWLFDANGKFIKMGIWE